MGSGIASGRNELAMEAATVFIVDDDEDVRNSISILARSVNLAVELFDSGPEFLDNYPLGRPGCLVRDVRMPGMSGLEVQQKLNEQDRRIPTIMLTAHAEVSMATQVMRAGAVDFMQKPFSPHILLERIHEAIQLDADIRRADQDQSVIAKLVASLSAREQEVKRLLAVGHTTKEIAAQLQISIKTVDNHRANVLEKMCVDNAAQLAHLLARSS